VPDPDASGVKRVLGVIVALVAAAALLYVTTTRRPSGLLNGAADEAETLNVTTEGEPGTAWPEVTEQDVAKSAVRYLSTDTNVRERPTAHSRLVAKLPRGTEVRGLGIVRRDGDRGWFRITVGRYRGYFIATGTNLSARQPPSLDTSFAGMMLVRQRLPIFAGPHDRSPVLRYSEPGNRLRVFGSLSNGMVEVGLKSGLVGYVARSAFSPAESKTGPTERQAAPAAPPPTTSTIYSPSPPSAPPAVSREEPRPPQFLNASTVVAGSDYPAEAATKGDQGTVRFSVTVDVKGRVADCRVLGSSGFASLDRSTCKVLRSRARFRPATGEDGLPSVGVYVGALTWRLND
jgi:TonB family protein